MVIDCLVTKFVDHLVVCSKKLEIQIIFTFGRSRLSLSGAVWKNKQISGVQMESKPSEDIPKVSEEPVKEESSESQQEEKPQTQEQETQKLESDDGVVSTASVSTSTSQVELVTQNGSDVNHDHPNESNDPSESKKSEEENPPQLIPPPPPPQIEFKRRIIVKHSILGNKIPSHDPNVLVESSTFTSIGKIQPFLITISTNAALVLDYHCHLTTSEVVGYLAGSWDVNSHSLNVTQAFPCKCRLGDYESAPVIESEIRKTIKSNGLSLVGWYHSHPTAPATPSIRDIETQLDYQLRMKGTNDSTYLPCIGVICSPYNLDNPSFESNIVSYWVVPPPENKIHEYGKPMLMSYSVVQDQSISHEILLEMKKCADFYKPEKDYIKFTEILKGPVTFLAKLKMSVISKFPLNHQKSEVLWNYLQDITQATTDKSETDILKQIIGISSTPSVTPPQPIAPPQTNEKPKFNIPNIPAPPPLTPMAFKSTTNSSLNTLNASGSNSGSSIPAAAAVAAAAATTTATTSVPLSIHYPKPHSRSKSTGKRSSSRDNKNLASLSNYFVGSDLAALFGSGKFPGMGLDPATKSLLNLNSLSLGGMFLPPMAAAAAAAAAASYKPDPSMGLMKPPPPPPNPYYSFPSSPTPSSSASSSKSSSASRASPGSGSSSSSPSPSPSSSSSSRSQNRSIPSTSSHDMPPPNKVPKIDVHQMANFFIPPNLGKNCTITNRPSTSTSSK